MNDVVAQFVSDSRVLELSAIRQYCIIRYLFQFTTGYLFQNNVVNVL